MSVARAVGLALGLALGLTAPARANPFDTIPYGARAMGLGGAYGALASDFAANHYNPAGLATGDDLQLELGYTLVEPSLALDGRDLEVDGVRGIQGGIVLPGRAWDRRLALSVALHLPDERVTRLRALPEAQPRFVLYDNHPQRLVLTTSIAVEIVKEVLYLGLGLTYLSDTQGRLRVAGEVDFQDAAGTTLVSAVDVDFEAVRYPSVGVLVRPIPELRIGLALREEFDLTLDIGVVVEGDIIIGGATGDPQPLVEDALLEVASRNSNLFSPRQLSLSAAWTAPTWTLAAELTWYQWSRFVSPTAHLTTRLDAGELPLAIPPNPEPSDPDFHDILVPRLGAEVSLVDGAHVGLEARAGAWYEPSPAPEQRGATNFADGDKLGFGLGLSLRFSEFSEVFPKPLRLDIGAIFIWMPEREHRKSDPADPTGDYVSSGTFLGMSSNLRFAF